MSKFTVLGDGAIRELLLSLSKEETRGFKRVIEDCLISISPGTESEYQPSPGIINRPDGQKTLFRPFTSPDHVGTKIIVHPAPAPASEASESTTASRNQQALHGIVVLVDKYGLPTGVLNVEEITAGKQALWHSRLALALRGDEIKTITIVNRSSERAQELIETVYDNNQAYWTSSCQLESLITTEDDFQSRLKMLLAQADAIFCTVPSRVPLFPLEYLKLDKRGGKYPFISAVGPWQRDMIELDPAIIHHVTQTPGFNSTGGLIGTVIVDDEKHALIHAGEIVQTGLTKDQILSIGQVLSWKREGSLGSEPTDGLNKWTSERLIVYKSIGVSVTYLVAANAILGLAAKKNLGTSISDF